MRDGDTIDCPVCGAEKAAEFSCDEVDVGVGIVSGNEAADCSNCGKLWRCGCGMWLSSSHDHTCWCGEADV
jgi:hypothetical protein